MTCTTTRRAFLAAASAAPTLALLAISTASPAQVVTVRPVFLRKLDRFRRLDAGLSDFEAGPCEDARARWAAAVEAIPHTTVSMGKGLNGNRIVFTTADKSHVAISKSIAAKPISDKQYSNRCIKLALAAQRREKAVRRAADECGLTALIHKSNRWGEIVAAAEWAFIKTPVATAAELEIKMLFMIEREAFSCDEASAAILADARALKGVAA